MAPLPTAHEDPFAHHGIGCTSCRLLWAELQAALAEVARLQEEAKRHAEQGVLQFDGEGS
jgi:hypothetical protein